MKIVEIGILSLFCLPWIGIFITTYKLVKADKRLIDEMTETNEFLKKAIDERNAMIKTYQQHFDEIKEG